MLCLSPGEVLQLLTLKCGVAEELLLYNQNETLLTLISSLLSPFLFEFHP